jgi:exodeoxyribonuclease VII large subunit
VISSERGAVIQDIRTTIARRFPRDILLWPVPVQGEGAAERIAAAIAGFERVTPRPDVLIVARGGGSLEDLMAFNEEIVIRAVAACRIPLISAVGHETDTTLIDFASDRRAPTPTAAAEMAVPARADLVADLLQKASRLVGALSHRVQERRLALSRAERGLPDLPALLGTARQRLDDRSERLDLALPNLLDRRRTALTAVERRLPDLPATLRTLHDRVQERGVRLVLALPNLVGLRRSALDLSTQRLSAGLRHAVAGIHTRATRVLARLSDSPVRAQLRESRAHLLGTAARLESVSPLAVLQRGYALVTGPAGHPLTSAAAVKPGSRLALRFADGQVAATADGGRRPERQGQLAL